MCGEDRRGVEFVGAVGVEVFLFERGVGKYYNYFCARKNNFGNEMRDS